MRLTVGNLKGGTAKTTSSVYLACGLARSGRTLLVDADPQGSALDWSTAAADFPVTVIPWAVPDLARRIGQVDADYDHVVIDTAPGIGQILRQALLATDLLVVPVAPTPMDLRRLGPTFDLAAEVDAISPVAATAMLARVRKGTRAAVDARDHLVETGRPVLAAETHQWESYSLAWGTTPAALGEYDAVLAELAALLGASS